MLAKNRFENHIKRNITVQWNQSWKIEIYVNVGEREIKSKKITDRKSLWGRTWIVWVYGEVVIQGQNIRSLKLIFWKANSSGQWQDTSVESSSIVKVSSLEKNRWRKRQHPDLWVDWSSIDEVVRGWFNCWKRVRPNSIKWKVEEDISKAYIILNGQWRLPMWKRRDLQTNSLKWLKNENPLVLAYFKTWFLSRVHEVCSRLLNMKMSQS